MIEEMSALFVTMVRIYIVVKRLYGILSTHMQTFKNLRIYMLVELCSSIHDGVVAFFTSYSYMENIICEWDGMGILRQLTKSKLVSNRNLTTEEHVILEEGLFSILVRKCGTHQNKLLLLKVSDGINFDRHY